MEEVCHQVFLAVYLDCMNNERTIARTTMTPITPITTCWVRMLRCCPLESGFFFAIPTSLLDTDYNRKNY